MKKILLLTLFFGRSMITYCQMQDMDQLKLDLEKLVQMRTMLTNMYNGYNTLSNGYSQATSLAKSNFDLHKNYLDQFLQVSAPVKNYPIIQTILKKQSILLTESVSAYNSFVKSGLFSSRELFDTKNQFEHIQSLVTRELDQLKMVLTPGTLRMSDQERISAIDRLDKDVGDAVASFRTLVKEQNIIAAIRGQQKKDNNAMRAWYGFKQ